MGMNLYIYTAKNGTTTYYVKNSFRDKNGKSTSKIVERLGTYEELRKEHDDPEAWARAYIDEMNRQVKEQTRSVTVSYSPNRVIGENDGLLRSGGYLFLQDIFYELGLDKTCRSIAQKYKYEYDLTDILAKLIYGRILFPGSKASTFEESGKLLEKPGFAQHDIYRALEVLSKEDGFIQSETYKNSRKAFARNDGILYYDCTNFFFEIEEESGLRQYGVSKEHRPNPIVQMGMFMDGDGIPMAFSIYSGNENEQGSMKPLEQKIIRDFEKARFIVCTDAGLSSTANRRFNSIQNRSFITAQSVKQMKAPRKAWALDPEGWRLAGDNKRYSINSIREDPTLYKAFYDKTFYKEQWFKEDNGLEQRFIVTFSLKYMEYLKRIRERQIQRAQKRLVQGGAGKKRQTDPERFYEQMCFTEAGELATYSTTVIDEDKIADEARYDGFYCVATDLEDPVSDILAINSRRWEIEESFRLMKTDFRSRPVYLRRDDRIKAHFLTCFLALYIFRILEKKLNSLYTSAELLKALRQYSFLQIPGSGHLPCYAKSAVIDALHNAFGFRTDYQINTNAMMKKIYAQTKS